MSNADNSQQMIVRKAFQSLRASFYGVGLVSIVINLLMLTGPLFMLQVYDRVLASGSVPTLVVIAALAFGLYVFYGILETLRGRVLARMGQRVDAQLSGESYALSNRLPLLLGPKAGQLRPVQDLDSIRQFLSGPGPAAIMDVPWMPFYLMVVFLFHPLLGFTALGGGLFIIVMIGLKEIMSRKPAQEFAQENNRRASLVEAGRKNSEVVHAMGMDGVLKQRWNQGNDSYLQKQRQTADLTNFFSTTVKSFRFLLQSAVLGVGAWLAIGQEVSPGIMIAASIMTSRALAPIEQAIAHWSSFVTARQARARLAKSLESRAEDKEKVELPNPNKVLFVEQLSCGPAGLKNPVVQNIDFTIEAGSGLGIIGASGSGKSTLARAIVGIVPALRGAVRFDGSELAQWDSERLGDIVGYLPQDIQLFDGTVGENISRFSPNADSADIIEAAKLADVDSLITSLPEGYNTRIGASGYALSAGQQQRIALARALYKKPFLILLDEPNSNLDAEGENALTSAIKVLREAGSIVIVIAHRPSAIAAVDKILVMQDGKQSAFGPKDEVLKKALAPIDPKAPAAKNTAKAT